MSSTIDIYHQVAEGFASQYNALKPEEVHQSWRSFWPAADALALDIGAGSGRDARWLAQQGCEVFAVEPAKALRELGQQLTGEVQATEAKSNAVHWLDDRLPELKTVLQLGLKFDLILVSAVWMHLTPAEQQRSFRKLSNLLKAGGRLVISLRHGDFNDGRMAYPVSVHSIEQLCVQHALELAYQQQSADGMGRDDVQWQTVVCTLPDDGSGSLSQVRHIILNSSKSSTYKLALLRTLVRIADAHPGAVLDCSSQQTILPVGLVVLYWIRQFKRLIDGYNLQQNSDPSKRLGFQKADGWDLLTHLTADDFAIGALFTGPDAKALQKLFSHCIDTIQQGPVTFIYQKTPDNPLFAIEKKRRTATDTVLIDKDFLASFGHFIIHQDKLWQCLRHYGCWIEPLLTRQWVDEMAKYQLNKALALPLETYYVSLQWLEQKRETAAVRDKVIKLQQQGEQVLSVWSGSTLQQFDIDHCLPFSYWPNNDQWNLLPCTAKENRSKSDRLPGRDLLQHSRGRINNWWQQANSTQAEQRRFFTEANLSLPGLNNQNQDFEQVFEALQFLVFGVKQRLQVGEWRL